MKELQKIADTPFTAHQLRHSYATITANSGDVPPKELQGMMGHATFATTMSIYAGLSNEKTVKAAADLVLLTRKSSEKVAANGLNPSETQKSPFQRTGDEVPKP